jgi:hypothetical protein
VSSDKIPKDYAEELGDCFTAYARGPGRIRLRPHSRDHALAEDRVQAAFAAAARAMAHHAMSARCPASALAANNSQQPRLTSFRHNGALGDHLAWREAVSRPPPADTTHAEAVSAIALQRCWQTIQALPRNSTR